MNAYEFIDCLETAWDEGGFLESVRRGKFDSESAEKFLAVLRSVDIPNEDHVPMRLLSLIWYLPTFLVWQRERVIESGGDPAIYGQFTTDVHNALENSLGVP
jgi:hypothetical protein